MEKSSKKRLYQMGIYRIDELEYEMQEVVNYHSTKCLRYVLTTANPYAKIYSWCFCYVCLCSSKREAYRKIKNCSVMKSSLMRLKRKGHCYRYFSLAYDLAISHVTTWRTIEKAEAAYVIPVKPLDTPATEL